MKTFQALAMLGFLFAASPVSAQPEGMNNSAGGGAAAASLDRWEAARRRTVRRRKSRASALVPPLALRAPRRWELPRPAAAQTPPVTAPQAFLRFERRAISEGYRRRSVMREERR